MPNILATIKTPTELLQYMQDNIKYGFVSRDGRVYQNDDIDWGRDWYSTCTVQSASGVLATNYGTCWDQVELERGWFTKHKYQFKTIFIIFAMNKPNNYPTHTFLAFVKKDKWYWFENSFGTYRGIHEYASLQELVADIIDKHLSYAIKIGVASESDKKLIKAYEYTKPRADCSVQQYLNHVTKNQLEVIL